ncbi:MAG TPA: sulfatase-like hydrolase/transferase [Kofleriaceae bacterium]|nr:sulfatase-like hydrolase/transferase [Kofleriaceae bacterium]
MRGEIVRAAWVLAAAALAPLLLEVAIGVVRVAPHGLVAIAVYLAMGLALAVACAAAAMVGAPLAVAFGRIWARALPAGWRPGAAMVHAAAVASALFVAGTAVIAGATTRRFQEAALAGLVVAVAGLVVLGAAVTAGAVVFGWARRAQRERPGWARHPLADARGAAILWLAIAWALAALLVFTWDAFELVFPGRIAAALSLAAVVAVEGRAVARLALDPAGQTRRRVRIGAAAAIVSAAVVLVIARHDPAREALLQAPPLRAAYLVVGRLSDLDRDGYTALFGAGDCAPFDGAIHPGARDVAGDGIDQNCTGADRVGRARAAADAPLPAELRRADYNLLLVSVDTLRYDHTQPGGYRRATTPRLAGLAARSAWCEQAHAAGNLTRDSLPVLAAGRHMAELPLGRQIPGSPFAPQVLRKEATTLAEVLAAAGYRTAMFTAFWYFDRWEISQGMERLVNLKDGNQHGVSPRIVQAAIDHLGELPPGERWFAWVHLLDPHVPYEHHPGFSSFGDTPADLYDADVAYGDHHLGVLLDWVAADPQRAARTVIVFTADHGEHLGEGGLQFHGTTLHAALTRVPLLVHVPGMTPRRVVTPISLVDLAPTLAAILGVSPAPEWTGESQLAALFLGREQPERVVFAADLLRDRTVAITTGYRLHLDAATNVRRLVDAARDPLEEADVGGDAPEVRQRLEDALGTWRDELADPAD